MEQNKINKWGILIILFWIFPLFGLCYIWKNINYFQKYLPIILLFCSSLYFVKGIILLSQVSYIKGTGAISDYFIVIVVFMVLFSLYGAILSFKTSSIIKNRHELPKKYINKVVLYLVVIAVLFPIALRTDRYYMNKKSFDEIEKTDKRFYENIENIENRNFMWWL